MKKNVQGDFEVLDRKNENGTAQIQVITAMPFQMTSRLICLSHATMDEPNTTDPRADCSEAYPNMTLKNV